jgi:hypothetical protein
MFERLGRYEAALWRQMLQTLVMLQIAVGISVAPCEIFEKAS